MGDKKQLSGEQGQSGMSDRIIGAILTPIFFNLATLIVAAKIFRRTKYLLHLTALQLNLSGILIFSILVIVPTIVGYSLGTSRCATLLGHFFYSNIGDERDPKKTVIAWVSLFAITYVLSRLIGD